MAVDQERGGPADSGAAWHLLEGGTEVARLVVTEGDFPWLNARVDEGPGFESVRPLFDEDLRALDRIDDDPAAFEAAYNRIRERLTLVDPLGRTVPEFLLHIDGDQAWWRWADEPFDQTDPSGSR